MNNLIKKVLISEKSFAKAAGGKYSFLVDKKLDKLAAAQLCEKLFNVTVLSVNTANYKGKIKSTKRSKGKRSDYKKVILTLKKGDKIDLFETETVEKENKKEKPVKKQKAKEAVK